MAMETPGNIHIPELIKDYKTGNSYVREEKLGEGSFGQCFKVHHDWTMDAFACKVISKSVLFKIKNRERVAEEIAVHRTLSHKYIVKFYTDFEDQWNIYILLELCDNGNLSEYQKKRGVIPEPEARYFLCQILKALKYLHGRKVVHRDIKLANIFITESMQLKLGDFGIAKVLETGIVKATDEICGTLHFMSPEVVSKQDYSYGVDIWAAGCIFYKMLIGSHAFWAKSHKETYAKICMCEYTVPKGKISEDAEKFISKMLQRSPGSRPSAKRLLLCSDYMTKTYIPKTWIF